MLQLFSAYLSPLLALAIERLLLRFLLTQIPTYSPYIPAQAAVVYEPDSDLNLRSIVLKAAGGEALHDLTLEQKEEDEHRQDRDHCARHLHIVFAGKTPL